MPLRLDDEIADLLGCAAFALKKSRQEIVVAAIKSYLTGKDRLSKVERDWVGKISKEFSNAGRHLRTRVND
jgi:hypothetical protein